MGARRQGQSTLWCFVRYQRKRGIAQSGDGKNFSHLQRHSLETMQKFALNPSKLSHQHNLMPDVVFSQHLDPAVPPPLALLAEFFRQRLIGAWPRSGKGAADAGPSWQSIPLPTSNRLQLDQKTQRINAAPVPDEADKEEVEGSELDGVEKTMFDLYEATAKEWMGNRQTNDINEALFRSPEGVFGTVSNSSLGNRFNDLRKESKRVGPMNRKELRIATTWWCGVVLSSGDILFDGSHRSAITHLLHTIANEWSQRTHVDWGANERVKSLGIFDAAITNDFELQLHHLEPIAALYRCLTPSGRFNVYPIQLPSNCNGLLLVEEILHALLSCMNQCVSDADVATHGIRLLSGLYGRGGGGILISPITALQQLNVQPHDSPVCSSSTRSAEVTRLAHELTERLFVNTPTNPQRCYMPTPQQLINFLQAMTPILHKKLKCDDGVSDVLAVNLVLRASRLVLSEVNKRTRVNSGNLARKTHVDQLSNMLSLRKEVAGMIGVIGELEKRTALERLSSRITNLINRLTKVLCKKTQIISTQHDLIRCSTTNWTSNLQELHLAKILKSSMYPPSPCLLTETPMPRIDPLKLYELIVAHSSTVASLRRLKSTINASMKISPVWCKTAAAVNMVGALSELEDVKCRKLVEGWAEEYLRLAEGHVVLVGDVLNGLIAHFDETGEVEATLKHPQLCYGRQWDPLTQERLRLEDAVAILKQRMEIEFGFDAKDKSESSQRSVSNTLPWISRPPISHEQRIVLRIRPVLTRVLETLQPCAQGMSLIAADHSSSKDHLKLIDRFNNMEMRIAQDLLAFNFALLPYLYKDCSEPYSTYVKAKSAGNYIPEHDRSKADFYVIREEVKPIEVLKGDRQGRSDPLVVRPAVLPRHGVGASSMTHNPNNGSLPWDADEAHPLWELEWEDATMRKQMVAKLTLDCAPFNSGPHMLFPRSNSVKRQQQQLDMEKRRDNLVSYQEAEEEDSKYRDEERIRLNKIRSEKFREKKKAKRAMALGL